MAKLNPTYDGSYYFAPDFDPRKFEDQLRRETRKKKRERAAAGEDTAEVLRTRWQLHYHIICDGCDGVIRQNTKFNTNMKRVRGETYLGMPVFTLAFRCPNCKNEITVKTDQEHRDYRLVSGGRRLTMTKEEERLEEKTTEVEETEEEKRKREEEDDRERKLEAAQQLHQKEKETNAMQRQRAKQKQSIEDVSGLMQKRWGDEDGKAEKKEAAVGSDEEGGDLVTDADRAFIERVRGERARREVTLDGPATRPGLAASEMIFGRTAHAQRRATKEAAGMLDENPFVIDMGDFMAKQDASSGGVQDADPNQLLFGIDATDVSDPLADLLGGEV